MTQGPIKNSRPLHIGKPSWLKTKIPGGSVYSEVKKNLRDRNLVTVCEEAKCPNIGECWNTRTATFMVCGDTCTRACRFCNVKTGNPDGWLDKEEPFKVAESAAKMKLAYVVITMVDRDDLADGGSAHVAQVVEAVRARSPSIIVETLSGDFSGSKPALQLLLDSGVHVFAHNLETVARLTPRVRDRRASYAQSLDVLEQAKEMGDKSLLTKSALMLGLGEQPNEVVETMKDLRRCGVDLLTIGQYMRPTKRHLSIKEWVHPDVFSDLEQQAYRLGFKGVASSPLVRSSYKAYEFYQRAKGIPRA